MRVERQLLGVVRGFPASHHMIRHIGDRVTWTSQSAGTWTTKRGEVVQVVLIGDVPHGISNPGRGRDHVSYVIRARSDGGQSKRYWPRVELLQEAREGAQGETADEGK